MNLSRLTLAVVVLSVVGHGAAFANPLLACDFEQGQTVLGLDGTGLVATNDLPPDPPDDSPYALRLAYQGAADPPAAAAQIVYAWQDGGSVGIWFTFTYFTETEETQWQIRARASDNLPGDPDQNDGDLGTILLTATPGWNWAEGTFTTGPEHDGLVLTIAPVVASPSPIWIDFLVVDGEHMTLATPCDQWVAVEGRSFSDVKALFR